MTEQEFSGKFFWTCEEIQGLLVYGSIVESSCIVEIKTTHLFFFGHVKLSLHPFGIQKVMTQPTYFIWQELYRQLSLILLQGSDECYFVLKKFHCQRVT
ncbi:unnamed protein product [Acanthoscelides obtectus]|uniref:Uncharacterized protein n=1 Tax=Acanthoscelides obtectus TaxID=200917 RepID=A0A9P0VRW8_ACAOB|nr:unnamed protein product [Acanthoscelides obtectus]CAK1687161.1 hypothetical protein AOBTE_LOCUS36197 [Acanthoscelides obtectus]